MDRLFPEFDIWSDFLVRERIEALNLDILESSHPIEIPGGVSHPGQVIIILRGKPGLVLMAVISVGGSGMIYSGSGSSFEFSEFRIQAKVPDPCGSGSNLY